MRKIFLLLFLSLCMTAVVIAEVATVSVVPSTAPLNDTVTITVVINTPEGYHPNPQQIASQLLTAPDDPTPFLIHGATIHSLQRSDSTVDHEVSISAEPLIPGAYTLSFGVIELSGKDMQPLSVIADVVNVTIEESPVTINDIIVPDLLPLPGRPQLGISAATWQQLNNNIDHASNQEERHLKAFRRRLVPWWWIGAAIVLFLSAYFFKKALPSLTHRSNRSADPRLVAMEALERLKEANFPALGRYDTFYVTLTAVVRRYIEDHYGLNAPEETTEEFLQEAQASGLFDDSTEKQLEEFLQHADMVKFAKEGSSTQECEEAFEAARTFVR